MGLTTSNLAHSWGLPKPIIKSHPEQKWEMMRVRANVTIIHL